MSLTPSERDFLAREMRLVSDRKTLPLQLRIEKPEIEIPTVRLDENDMEDTIPGVGEPLLGFDLGVEVPSDDHQ
jgi:hypothetical protein